MALDKQANSIRRQLSKLGKQRRAILDSDAPAAEQRRRTDALAAQEEKVLQQFNTVYVRALRREQAAAQ